MVLLSFLFVAPYINILAKALNAARDTMLGGVTFCPRDFTWDNFRVIFIASSTWRGLIVSVARVVVGSVLSLFVHYMAAYALLRKGLRFKKAIIIFFSIPMFVSGGLISEYIFYPKLGVYNTFWVYIFPSMFSFYNMVVIRTYLQGIPDTLLESARLDGAGEVVILFKIMLPLSMPDRGDDPAVVRGVALERLDDTLYFVENSRLYTLQFNLQQAIKQAETTQNMIQQAIESGRPLGDIDTDIKRASRFRRRRSSSPRCPSSACTRSCRSTSCRA